MARSRAGDAATRAFGRSCCASRGIPAGSDTGAGASISASEKDGESAVIGGVIPDSAGAGTGAVSAARKKDGRKTGKKAGKRRRRVGRPRGPERVPLTIRILAATDVRLTAAVEATGESPQYIVDKALAAYLDALGVPKA